MSTRHTADEEALTELFARSSELQAPSSLRDDLHQRLFGSPATARTGDRIGRYVLDQQLGAGGMGVVYRAHDPELERSIAIKLVRIRDSDSDAAVERRRSRMMREAQAMAQLRHPNVVTVHDVGLHNGHVFIAMDLVEGITLKQWLRTGTRHWREIVQVFLAAGAGLYAAHQAGLIHRDFKPSNVLIDSQQQVHVIDFGLVKHGESTTLTPEPISAGSDEPTGPSAQEITRPGSVMGTVAYMSPEQLAKAPLDARSDQFSFCVTLFEALYGNRPYAGSTPQHLSYNLHTGAMVDPTNRVGPRWLERICRRGLSPNRDLRYADMPRLLVALERGFGRRRRFGFAAGLVATLGLGLGLAAAVIPGDPIAPCAPEKLAAHGLWQEPVRAEIRGALEAAETPLGEERWVAVDRILRDASRAHLGAVAQVCRDTASGQLESRQAEVRTECLAEQARLVRDRIDDLSHAGTETVVSAIEKLSFLPSPQACLQHPVAERAPEQKVAKLQRALDQSISQQLDAASSRERAGKYREALELTEAATAAAERGASDEIRAQAWTFQAMLETHLGRTSEAERSRERALRLAERTHQHDVWLSLVAAKVRSLGVDAFQTEDAQWWKDEALAGQKFDREPHPLRAAELEAARGDLLWVAGDLSQAIDAQRRALTIREKILGPRHLDVAQTLNDLGVALADDHQYNRAREVLERSLRIREAKLGHNHPFVASTLNNLGTILRTQGELSGARNALERSLAIKRYHWGGRHPHTARALHNLGRLAREQGDLEGAISSYQQALEIREAIHGKVHPDVATTLNAMAVALKKLGRRSEAKAAFERALAIRLEKYGSDHLKVASTHNSLGMLLVELGQPNQALAHFSRSVEIREKRLANDDPRFAWALRNLGHAALVVGDWPAARRHLSRVLPVDEVNLASGTANSSDLARTKFWLAQATEDHVGAPVLAQAARKLAVADGDQRLVAEIDQWLESLSGNAATGA